jgi:hypothetical protein
MDATEAWKFLQQDEPGFAWRPRPGAGEGDGDVRADRGRRQRMTDSYIQTPEERIDDLARDVLVAGYLARTASSPRTTPTASPHAFEPRRRTRSRPATPSSCEPRRPHWSEPQPGSSRPRSDRGGSRRRPYVAAHGPRSAVSWAHPGPVAVRSCSAPKSRVRQRGAAPPSRDLRSAFGRSSCGEGRGRGWSPGARPARALRLAGSRSG